MLYPRIIPCLLVHNNGLVKTIKFQDPKYVGDPLNAVKIFNEKEADELIILDVDATVENKEPDYEMIKNLAIECRMPLCYGGGIKTVEQAQRILGLGVEKIALSSAAVESPEIISKIAERVGSQSITIILDLKKDPTIGQYQIFTHRAQKNTKERPVDWVKKIAEMGAGEVVLNFIDEDGVMGGYDLEPLKQIRSSINLPIVVLGGAGSLQDIENLISQYGIIGAAAGSLFVFKGKYRAVLINYPDPGEKDALIKRALHLAE